MLYHEWLKMMFAKERTNPSPQGDLFLHGYTQCAECGRLLAQEDAAVHVYYDNNGQQEEHFCPDTLKPEESCQQVWYMKRLRREGV